MDHEVGHVVVEARTESFRAEVKRHRLVHDRTQPEIGETHRQPEGGERCDPAPQVHAASEQQSHGDEGDQRNRDEERIGRVREREIG
jgi:hypothetical protein